MARPLRLQFSGALYHVTSRGDGRDDIYFGEADRAAWLNVLERTCERFNWRVHAWCQMTNHYHLLLETPEGNLSAGMRQLNGVYMTCSPQAVPIRSSKGSAIQENRGHEEEQIH